MRKPRRKTDYIVIHSADTPKGMDIGRAEIDRWHRRRGFLEIGYHYVIRIDGTVEPGRIPDSVVGAHVKGFNYKSIGICLVGGAQKEGEGRPEDLFFPEQLTSLEKLAISLLASYPGALLAGHRQFESGKLCPGFSVPAWAQVRGFPAYQEVAGFSEVSI